MINITATVLSMMSTIKELVTSTKAKLQDILRLNFQAAIVLKENVNQVALKEKLS